MAKPSNTTWDRKQWNSKFKFQTSVLLIICIVKKKISGLQITNKASNIGMWTFEMDKVNKQIKYSWRIVHKYSQMNKPDQYLISVKLRKSKWAN